MHIAMNGLLSRSRHGLLVAAFAVSCSPAASPGDGTDGGIANTSDAAAASSGASSAASTSPGGSDASSGTSSGGTSDGPSSGGTSGGSGLGSSGASAAGSGTSDGGSGGPLVGGEAGASAGCTGKSYKLCEDFESGTVAGTPTGWTSLTGYATQRGGVGLANDAFHSGSMSLKSDSMSNGQDRVQKSLAALGPTATKHWGRIFYKVGSPAPKPNSNVLHITFTALEGTTENRVVDTVINTNGAHQWLFNIPSDKCCSASAYNWTFDTSWHCAEWSIDVAAKSFRFFSDSKEVTQLAFMGNTGALMSNYTNIALGTIFYQTPPTPVVVWFDDLAIDDNQIGCQ